MSGVPLVNIGGVIEKETCENYAAGITAIFDSAHRNHIEQETIRVAITSYSRALKVENVTLNDFTITTESKGE